MPSGLKLALWLQSGALFLGPLLGPPPFADFWGPTSVPTLDTQRSGEKRKEVERREERKGEEKGERERETWIEREG